MKKEWTFLIDGTQMDNDEIISAICESRNIDNIGDFLNPSIDCLIDYKKLININKAFEEFDYAISTNLGITILADVDTDGCTAGAIMYRYIKNFSDNVTISINEGKIHGISEYDIQNCDAGLVIIVDSINKAEEYNKFTALGKRVIVLDHHILPSKEEEYNHITLVSSANHYPNSHLSGAGVVWKFCKYCDEMYLTDYADYLVDLAATGIIADMCDMNEPENRYICNLGLKNLNNPGLKKANGTYIFDSQSVSFGVAPLVNACNRLNENEFALELFIADDEDGIKAILKHMKFIKDKQNEIVDSLMDNVLIQAEQQIDEKIMYFTIDCESGIAGLLANKLISMYERPILVLKETENEYRGSMRACGVDDFCKMINDTGLARCDGHENAAGFFVEKDKFNEFLVEIKKVLTDYDFTTKTVCDIKLNIDQINTALIESFKAINFVSGTGFKPLTVMIEEIDNYEVGNMSGGKHLKITASDVLLLKWNYTGGFDEFDGSKFSIIGGLNCGYFGRNFYNQVIINDYKIGE